MTEKNDKQNLRIPLQKFEKPSNKSIRSQHTRSGARAERVSSQPSPGQSHAQASKASKHPHKESSALHNASKNQNEVKSLYENVGFCFTKENEAVMKRVLQETVNDVEKEIANLKASRTSHTTDSKTIRKRGI